MSADDLAWPASPADLNPPLINARAEELRLASRLLKDGMFRTELSVPGVHCAGCIRRVESTLSKLDGVEYARVNLSTRRAAVHWRPAGVPPPILEALDRLGYEAHLFEEAPAEKDHKLTRLIRALAVAGFCAMNIMLFSVSVWAGADAETRNLFHWISAVLALPALIYSGRIFFLPAWRAVRRGHTNMDVPISIGVTLAFGLSLYDTLHHGAHAYFDASVTLLFFLLVGRTLDHVMRERARVAVTGLAKLAARGATIVKADGGTVFVPVGDIEPGTKILLAAGERVPVDAEVEAGVSDLDCSLVSGESGPTRVGPGSAVRAGTLNLTGSLRLRATANAAGSFLAEMIRLMEVAEGGRAQYRRIADRASQLYAPVVHLAALATLTGWMLIEGDWHRSISIAIAVLIITCPCALGLAVPIVQVVASRRLFESAVMVKDGSAMERLAQIDTIVFDKTGTLTSGSARLANQAAIDPQHLEIAAAIAAHSRHPLSQSLSALGSNSHARIEFVSVTEVPGSGVEAVTETATYRLGRAAWALSDRDHDGEGAGTVLARDGVLLTSFSFEDTMRDGAIETIAELRRRGYHLLLLSGDQPGAVTTIANQLNINDYAAQVLPAEKMARIEALTKTGRRVLMVGDGLNDAPALSVAHASIAPAEAADIGRNAADFVFMRRSLTAVLLAIDISSQSGRLIRQNIILAVAYNAIAVPVAMLGYVTPLIAALAMSLSSIVVVANALRLRGPRPASVGGADALARPGARQAA
ncbi:MAG: heavy metal translocating P-type ATPase [Devosia sp.]